MELLHSIKKQRELFSQTLSAAQMPTRLDLGGNLNDPEECNLNPAAEPSRKPLSPRSKKTGVNDARQLVSSLRSKREDLFKRFENSNISPRKRAELDQENDSSINKKGVVDVSWIKEERQAEEDRSGLRPSKLDYSKFEKRDEPRPSGVLGESKVERVAESFSTFENQPKLQSLPKREPASEQGDASWIKQAGQIPPPSLPFLRANAKKQPWERKDMPSEKVNPASSEANSWIKPDLDEDTNEKKSKAGGLSGFNKQGADSTNQEDETDTPWTSKGPQPEVENAVNKKQAPTVANVNVTRARNSVPEPSWIRKRDEEQRLVGSPRVNRKSVFVGPADDPKAHHARRKSVGSTLSWAKKDEDIQEEINPRSMLKPVKKTKSDDRRKSAPAASWIKHGSAPEGEPDKDKKAELPWVQKHDQTTRSNGQGTLKQQPDNRTFAIKTEEALETCQAANTRLAPGSPVAKFATKRFSASPTNPVASPEWTKPKLASPRGGNITSRMRAFGEANGLASSQQEPHKMVQNTKVSTFNNKAGNPPVAPMSSPSNNGILAAARLKREEAQRYPSAKGPNAAKTLDFARSSNFSSLMKSMEKISLGDEAESHHSGEEECGTDHQSDASAASGSVDQVFEYGDANFSFTDVYDEDARPEEGYFDYDDASEGSTYKVDNYQKDFNAAIPIRSPWEIPPDAFENAASDIGAMKIISIAPSETQYESSFDQGGFSTISSNFQDNVYDTKPPTDKSLTKRRTTHQVARNSLLSATTGAQANEQALAIAMLGAEEVDPIFQVSDEGENKTKSNKGMFKILKKGLGSSSSKKGASDEEALEGFEDVPDDLRSNTRTTISSISRSVTSNPDHSHRSSDSKPTLPLGVFNGFFKAARKYQKKRKTKSRRGRSMSNKPPTIDRRRGDMIVDFKQQGAMVPAPDVQLWPSFQIPEPVRTPTVPTRGHQTLPTQILPPQTPAANNDAADRRFGTYGGLLYASSRSKALDASIAPIQSLASW